MLAISTISNNNPIPELGFEFVVTSVELIDDTAVEVWFTRDVTNGTDINNFSISGPSTRSVVLCQYGTDARSIRIYFDTPLTIGQWC